MPCPYAMTFAGCKSQSTQAIIHPMNRPPLHKFLIHHRRSIRLAGYDYTQPGAYFITTCAAGRLCVFGEVDYDSQSFRPSRVGQLVIECWNSIPAHHPNVELDEFVLMPNHLHGILKLIDLQKEKTTSSGITVPNEAFGKPVQGSIPTIVRSFKSAVSHHIAIEEIGIVRPVWQRNYYESVIRTNRELNHVRRYILGNPANWSEDPENPAVIKASRPR